MDTSSVTVTPAPTLDTVAHDRGKAGQGEGHVVRAGG